MKRKFKIEWLLLIFGILLGSLVGGGVRAEVNTLEEKLDYYRTGYSQWGLTFLGSTPHMGQQQLESSATTSLLQPTNLQIDANYYVSLGSIGSLGFGPRADFLFAESDDFEYTVFQVGGRVEYLLQIGSKPLLVPGMSYQLLKTIYNLGNGKTGSFNTSGLGLALSLNISGAGPDPSQEIYMRHGIRRTYLVTEFQNLHGKDQQLTISGGKFLAGIRIEI